MELKAVTAPPTVRYAKGLHVVEDLPGILAKESKVADLRQRLADCECLLIKGAIEKEPLLRIREYLSRVGQSSLRSATLASFARMPGRSSSTCSPFA